MRTPWPIHDLELDLRISLQRSVALHVDRRVMDEYVLIDEPVSLFVTKPPHPAALFRGCLLLCRFHVKLPARNHVRSFPQLISTFACLILGVYFGS